MPITEAKIMKFVFAVLLFSAGSILL